ncbi:MAG: hypothetical protein P1P88_03420 [Bacteroidales bacterium]|nr:hypothetical protein [Bacteroidales bacterium]
MANKKEITRNFKSTDSELIQLADKVIAAAERDFVSLKEYGLKKEYIKEAINKRKIFSEMPTDEEILADKTASNTKKTDSHEALRMAMKAVLSRITLHFGKTSPELKKAGGEALTGYSDAEFCQKARRIERTGRENIEALAEVGLTPEILDALNTLVNEYDDLIDVQKDLAVQRDIKTRERISKANELYEYCVKISDYGKAAFDGVNPALLESYKLTDRIRKTKNNTETAAENTEESNV